MIAFILETVDDVVMSIDPVFLVKASAVCTASFLVLALIALMVIGEKRRVRIDPMSEPFGDVPGFSAEQLRKIARMPVPPHGDPQRRSFTHSPASRGVALRVQNAGAVSHIPSGGAGGLIGHKPLYLVVDEIVDLGPAPEVRRG